MVYKYKAAICAEAKSLYDSGLTYTKIGDRLGVTSSEASEMIREYDLRDKIVADSHGVREHISKLDINDYHYKLLLDKGYTKIALVRDMSREDLKRALSCSGKTASEIHKAIKRYLQSKESSRSQVVEEHEPFEVDADTLIQCIVRIVSSNEGKQILLTGAKIAAEYQPERKYTRSESQQLMECLNRVDEDLLIKHNIKHEVIRYSSKVLHKFYRVSQTEESTSPLGEVQESVEDEPTRPTPPPSSYSRPHLVEVFDISSVLKTIRYLIYVSADKIWRGKMWELAAELKKVSGQCVIYNLTELEKFIRKNDSILRENQIIHEIVPHTTDVGNCHVFYLSESEDNREQVSTSSLPWKDEAEETNCQVPEQEEVNSFELRVYYKDGFSESFQVRSFQVTQREMLAKFLTGEVCHIPMENIRRYTTEVIS